MTESTMNQEPLNQNMAPPRHIVIALLVAVLAQVSVLIGEWAIAHYPVWTGQEIRLRVQPVDPRDLFRGNYVRLGYDLTTLPMDLGEQTFDRGDVVYVSLKQGKDEQWVADTIHQDPPDREVFLRARIMRVYHGHYEVFRGFDEAGDPIREQVSTRGSYRLRYGIEAWFAPKLRAREIESRLRDGGWVTVSVADSGRAALVDLDLDLDQDTDDAGQ